MSTKTNSKQIKTISPGRAHHTLQSDLKYDKSSPKKGSPLFGSKWLERKFASGERFGTDCSYGRSGGRSDSMSATRKGSIGSPFTSVRFGDGWRSKKRRPKEVLFWTTSPRKATIRGDLRPAPVYPRPTASQRQHEPCVSL